jgi:hypothetical protein
MAEELDVFVTHFRRHLKKPSHIKDVTFKKHTSEHVQNFPPPGNHLIQPQSLNLDRCNHPQNHRKNLLNFKY